jgi:uncharacterized protein (TIGR00251 family)
MKWHIKVKPNSHKDRVEKISDTDYQVYITAPPVDGKANEYLIKFLADFFAIPKSAVQLQKGQTSQYKTVELGISESEFNHKIQSL